MKKATTIPSPKLLLCWLDLVVGEDAHLAVEAHLDDLLEVGDPDLQKLDQITMDVLNVKILKPFLLTNLTRIHFQNND